jgi:hypothetical protein
MAIDVKSEQLVALRDVGASLPWEPAGSTLSRWHSRGVRGVRLDTVLVGGKRWSSREAIQRFIEAVTAAGASPFSDSNDTGGQ